MAALRELLAAIGLEKARTLLQSGNAVFESRRLPSALEGLIAAGITERFGLATDVFVRTAREWDAALAANPFPREAKDDPSHLLVMPLRDAPSAASVEALRASIRGRERVTVVGRQAFLVYPDGIGRSKLTLTHIESRLGTRGTARNWNTAGKLAALAREG
jgi:uncharacterized protein (DUF1697 family)